MHTIKIILEVLLGLEVVTLLGMFTFFILEEQVFDNHSSNTRPQMTTLRR